MSTEQLIHDSTLVSVTLDERNDPSGSEQYRIQNALERICHDRQADVVVLFGRAHKILRWRQAIPTSHSSFTTNDRGCSAEIFLEVCDEPAQQARIEVKLTRRDDDPLLSWLTIEFNPTTILGGAWASTSSTNSIARSRTRATRSIQRALASKSGGAGSGPTGCSGRRTCPPRTQSCGSNSSPFCMGRQSRGARD
jgi:hypothetical protein